MVTTAMFVFCEPRPVFANICWLQEHGQPHLLFHVHNACNNQYLKPTQNHAHQSNAVAGLQECSLAVCKGILFCKAHAADLQFAQNRYNVYSHVPFTGSHTHQSIKIIICHRGYAQLGICNMLLTQCLSAFHGFTNPSHTRIEFGSDMDCYPDQRVIRISSHDPISMLFQPIILSIINREQY